MLTAIPPAALESHIGVLAKTGAGKTYGTKSAIIEPALAAGERVCIIDPTDVYWGLRLNKTGTGASAFKPVIFGGPHADYAINEEHGAALAMLVATTNMSCIIVTRGMKATPRARFFTAFAETLLGANRGALRLIIDEAHLFAPKGKVMGAAADLVNATNELVSGGRSAGIKIVLISQRCAKLHNDSLTQIETIIALRVINPWDRGAIEDWIKGAKDKEKGQALISDLSSLRTGEAIIWAPDPDIDIFDRIRFQKIKTFDSSSGQGSHENVNLVPVDLEKVEQMLSEIAKKVIEDDPTHLKKEIVRLNKELAIEKAKPAADQLDMNAALLESYDRGQINGYNNGWKAAWPEGFKQGAFGANGLATETIQATLDKLRAIDEKALIVPRIPDPVGGPQATPCDRTVPAGIGNGYTAVRPAPRTIVSAGRQPSASAARHAPTTDGGGLSGPEHRILNSIAWWHHRGHDAPANAQVAWLAGYSPNGSAYTNPRSSLKSKGLVDYPQSDCLSCTGDGRRLAVVQDTGTDLLDWILERLSGPEGKILRGVAAAYPEAIPNAAAAEAASYSPDGSAYTNPRSSLRSKGLITYPKPDHLLAAPWIFT